MRQRKKIPLMRHYANDTLNDTWRRLSRHMWKHRYQHADPTVRRLKAARDRPDGRFLEAELCDCA